MTALLERRLPAMLGHELRNPLAGAITNVAVAAELTDAEDPRANMLRLAQQDLSRLAKLLDRCLDFADLGRLARQRVDVRALVNAIVDRRSDGSVTLVAGTEHPSLELDRALAERAIENLVENAFAAGAGRVTIRIGTSGSTVFLEVADDGPGVPAELRARVFEPFVSGRGSRGLGLPFVREVVTAHGGTVQLLDSAPGATFRIEFAT